MQNLSASLDLAVLRSKLGSDMEDALDVERVIQDSQQAMQELEQRISALRDKFETLETSLRNLEEEWEEVDGALAIQREKRRHLIAWGLRREKSRREEKEERRIRKGLRRYGEGEGGDVNRNVNEETGDGQQSVDGKKGGDNEKEEGEGKVVDEDGGEQAGGDEEDKKRKRKDSGNSSSSNSSTDASGSSDQTAGQRGIKKGEVLGTSSTAVEPEANSGRKWQVLMPKGRVKKTRRHEAKRVRMLSPGTELSDNNEREKGEEEEELSGFSVQDQFQARIFVLEERLKRYDEDMEIRVQSLERRVNWNEQGLRYLDALHEGIGFSDEEGDEENNREAHCDDKDNNEEDNEEDEDSGTLQDSSDNSNSNDSSNDHNSNNDVNQSIPSTPSPHHHPTTSRKHLSSTIPSGYGVGGNLKDVWPPGFSSD